MEKSIQQSPAPEKILEERMTLDKFALQPTKSSQYVSEVPYF